jgi:hypothetical protein
VSERVTWTACPRCGSRAAVGWAPVGDAASEDVPVEFDCPAGCRVSIALLAQVLVRQARRHPPRSPGRPR